MISVYVVRRGGPLCRVMLRRGRRIRFIERRTARLGRHVCLFEIKFHINLWGVIADR